MKKIQFALEKTYASIQEKSNIFLQRLVNELHVQKKDLSEKFLKDNEEILATLAGEKLISEKSEKEIKMYNEKKICVEQCTANEYSCDMRIGDSVKIFGMILKLSGLPSEPKIEHKIHTVHIDIPIVCHNNKLEIDHTRIEYGDVVELDCIIDQFSITRMKITKTTTGDYLCEQISQTNGQINIEKTYGCIGQMKPIDQIEPSDQDHTKILLPKTYQLSDFKIGEKVLAFWVVDNSIFDFHFYVGHVTKLLKDKIEVNFDDGDSCKVNLDQIKKWNDLPDKFINKTYSTFIF